MNCQFEKKTNMGVFYLSNRRRRLDRWDTLIILNDLRDFLVRTSVDSE